ncbi:MAG TPA: FAD-dependent oxidoreductase [Kofleriaceae bacterium]|nr:FAD-dependent oxidoreductase [Kofleriaceae bacterium]
MPAPRVIVIGGGVAGLTVAHELAERGFGVDVYEARGSFGGKARSQPVPETGTAGRRDLPGEHGFRFYPRFYRHVIDQMARIPVGPGTVADTLKPTTEAAIALIDDDTWYRFSRKKLTTPYSILETLEIFFQNLDFDAQDVTVFGAKLLQFATACDARRLAEYEQVSWWTFLEAEQCSEKFQRQLRGIPRMMVAMDAQRGSARTIGVISVQLLRDFSFTGMQNDRTLGGPTTQMWIEPWLAHLQSMGVTVHAGQPIAGIEVADGRISGLRLPSGRRVTGDHYVLAVPMESAIALLTTELGMLDPQLERLRVLQVDDLVSWMSGIQYFLYEDVPLVRGHLFFPDSPWALTAVSQPQFWRDLGLFRRVYGDGTVGGLISVDISDWGTPGKLIPKPAKECTRQEIADEVWWQLKAALNGVGEGGTILSDELLHSWHLDDDLDILPGGGPTTNSSRLLVHPPGSWALRPEAASTIPNLALAGDYVRTHTNIASMESACEAGRRAANVILDRAGSSARRADVWPLEEPAFRALKWLDHQLFQAGRPHLFELLGIRQAVRAAAVIRRAEELLGLAKLDDWADQYKLTTIVKVILARLGVR